MTADDLLKAAHEQHKAQRLDEAERLYRQALELDPAHAGATHSLGLLCHLRGWQQQAEEWISRAIALDPTQAHFHNNLGLVLRAQGRFPEAADRFAKAVELRPDYALALKNLGLIRGEQGRHEEAAECLQRAARLEQQDPEAYYQLGQALHRQNKPEAARGILQRAVQLQPQNADAWNDLAILLKDDGQEQEAISHFRRAVEADPRHVRALCNLAVALSESGDQPAAAEAVEQALRVDPESVGAHQALGLVQYHRGEFDAAIEQLQWVIHSGRASAMTYNNLGSTLRQVERLDEALEQFDRALWLEPDRADVHLNRAMVWLARGRFREGWTEYEWRRRHRKRKYPQLPRPMWDGTPLQGRRILLFAEQGLGDTLQFIRYVPAVQARGGHVILACQKVLLPLLEHCRIGDERVAVGQPTGPSFDVQAALMSLPGLFKTDLESIPADVPYLHAVPELVTKWQARLAELDGLRVGISWQGSANYADDAYRSVPLRYFRALAELPGVRLISLQKGYGTEQLQEMDDAFPVHLLEEDFDESQGAFMDTAAVMKCLDLVITSDTAVAHLAGALGVPVWAVLGRVPDWRWLLEREDCPWYPTMRLFRQHRRGDWSEVFERLAAELSTGMPRSAHPETEMIVH